MQDTFDALQSPVRREILSLIWDRELPVGEIAAEFEVSAPTISQHLKTLRDAGLVVMVADGNFRRYRAHHAALRDVRSILGKDPERWRPADDLPEIELARVRTGFVVTASVDVATDVVVSFSAFNNADLYSEWLGVPVTLRDGRFASTLEWGTRIRGHYDVVVANELIALRWDFEDDNVPIPGGEMIAYMRFIARRDGCRIEVHQLCDTQAQVEFMDVAWRMVLGRYREFAAANPPKGLSRQLRPRRPKRK